ncbi:MAG TPA: class I SAM-dependent methyltransferase [Mobilitalea sp.]|nr:class I SAM-dependent methyltransferase [Mobilitalea sp.]
MLEKMSNFFEARVEGYDNHMINNVAGCNDGYKKMSELLPKSIESLLDLGCGTGLELDEIFKTHQNIKVTGVDLTKAMLDRLQEKYHNKNITLINASYFDYDFGIDKFDAVVSFQTMHHFSHDMKIKLYSRVYSALKPSGKYIECDYMVVEQAEEDHYYRENERIRKEQNIPEGEFYHYDTPCTMQNQIRMLKLAGFEEVKMVWRKENTTIIVADKTQIKPK